MQTFQLFRRMFQEFIQSGLLPPLARDSFISLLTPDHSNSCRFFIKTRSSTHAPLLWLAPSAANRCYGINLSWYPVLSKFATFNCKHWRVFVDSLSPPQNIDINQYMLKLCENIAGVRNFLNNTVEYGSVVPSMWFTHTAPSCFWAEMTAQRQFDVRCCCCWSQLP